MMPLILRVFSLLLEWHKIVLFLFIVGFSFVLGLFHFKLKPIKNDTPQKTHTHKRRIFIVKYDKFTANDHQNYIDIQYIARARKKETIEKQNRQMKVEKRSESTTYRYK